MSDKCLLATRCIDDFKDEIKILGWTADDELIERFLRTVENAEIGEVETRMIHISTNIEKRVMAISDI